MRTVIHRLFFFAFFLFLNLVSLNGRAEETLRISLLVVGAEQRAAYIDLGKLFEKENPGVRVVYLFYDNENYKAHIASLLQSDNPPDVLYWQAGERLLQYARLGLLEPVTDLWRDENLDVQLHPGVRTTVSLGDEIYAIPFAYYQWGFYYLRGTFQRLNIAPPGTWDEFLNMCRVMNDRGIDPIIIGTENYWTSAAWFDYLNLRLNGLTFHRDLTAGNIAYDDHRVRKVFVYWKQLLDEDCFVSAKLHRSWTWDQGLPFIYRGRGGVGLFGNFVTSQIPAAIYSQIGFFPFPRIDTAIAPAEEAPTDVFMMASSSLNKELARRFLAFISRADVQAEINNPVGVISTNRHARMTDDYFLQKGAELLSDTQGVAQFYDRDAPKPMADAGIRIFTRFMETRNIDETLAELERARLEHY